MKMQHAAIYTALHCHWKLRSADKSKSGQWEIGGLVLVLTNSYYILWRGAASHTGLCPGNRTRLKSRLWLCIKNIKMSSWRQYFTMSRTQPPTLELWNLETLKPGQSSASPARWKSEEKQLTVARVNISKYSDQQRPSARWDFGRKQNLVSTFRSLLALTNEI